MQDKVDFLLDGLSQVHSSVDLENWVRTHLRRHISHAALLGTFGKLYGLGSVTTHKLGVDFPLNLAEATKDRFGAIDDPLVCEWFETGKMRFVSVADISNSKQPEHWHATLQRYGISNLLVFGVLDHTSRRFAFFQMCNVPDGGKSETKQLIAAIVLEIARKGWSAFSARAPASSRQIVGHPTIALTATELQIIEFLALGLSNKEIARRRGVSSSTIKTQVSRTGAKLGATRRAEIVAIGISMLSTLPAQGVESYDNGRFVQRKD